MPRPLPDRRMPTLHLAVHRPPRHRARRAQAGPTRSSDLVLALLGVVLLGGLALAAAFALAAGTPAP